MILQVKETMAEEVVRLREVWADSQEQVGTGW